MKNVTAVLLFFVVSICCAQETNFKEKRDQIKSLKVALITSELNLTADEATKFWPIFNEFEEKQFELKRQKLKGYLSGIDEDELNKMSDKEANQVLNQIEANEEEMLLLRKKLVQSLRGIISPVKIIKLRKVEEEFNRKLLQQYRDKVKRK